MPKSGRGFALLMIVLCALAGYLAVAHLVLVPLRIPLNYNEGWMAFFSTRAVAGGGPLYPPDGLINNNYPPLSFYPIGALGLLLGDAVAAGRIVAFAALLAVAGEVFWSARRLGAGVSAATAGSLIFLVFNLTWFHAYVGMADPQWLGEAASLLGLPLLLRAGEARLSPWRPALAAVAMVAGGFVKHNLFALPLAAGLWLLFWDRRGLAVFAAAAVAALAAGALATWSAYGPVAFADVLGDHRRLLVSQWLDAVAYLIPMSPLIAAASLLARDRWGEKRVRLAVLFTAVAVPLSVVERLGEGINVNGHFEALVAVSVAAATAVDAAPVRALGRPWGRAGLAFALAAPSLFASPYFAWRAGEDLIRAPAKAAGWERVIAAVRAAPGPVACEMLSICYWAGKGFEVDFFNYGQDLRAGVSPAPFTQAIAEGRFGALMIVRDRDYFAGQGRLPQPAPDAIEQAYAARLTAPDGEVLMTPKSSGL